MIDPRPTTRRTAGLAFSLCPVHPSRPLPLPIPSRPTDRPPARLLGCSPVWICRPPAPWFALLWQCKLYLHLSFKWSCSLCHLRLGARLKARPGSRAHQIEIPVSTRRKMPVRVIRSGLLSHLKCILEKGEKQQQKRLAKEKKIAAVKQQAA